MLKCIHIYPALPIQALPMSLLLELRILFLPLHRTWPPSSSHTPTFPPPLPLCPVLLHSKPQQPSLEAYSLVSCLTLRPHPPDPAHLPLTAASSGYSSPLHSKGSLLSYVLLSVTHPPPPLGARLIYTSPSHHLRQMSQPQHACSNAFTAMYLFLSGLPDQSHVSPAASLLRHLVPPPPPSLVTDFT